MALDIDNATIGYSQQGVQQYVEEINTKVIENTRRALNSGLAELRAAVNEVWVGTSAETFKSNMEHDADRVREAIADARDVLIGELKDIVNKMGEIDENLIQAR